MSARFIAGVVALAAIVVALFTTRPQPPAPLASTGDLPAARPWKPAASGEVPSRRVVTLPIASGASRLHAADGSCREDLAYLDLVISQYSRHFGGNPVGDNQEISAALRGDNDKGVALLPSEGPFLDQAGRLMDRWGTPYFFHAVASRQMEILSAGPDREFWTGDDIAAHPTTVLTGRQRSDGGSPPGPVPDP